MASLVIRRITTPWPLLGGPVAHLAVRAFQTGPADPDDARLELSRLANSPNLCLLVGEEDDVPKALAVTMLPSSRLFSQPQVYHFYSEGPKRLTHRLLDELVSFIEQHGYNSLYAVNWSGRSDETWTRTFRRVGQATRVGSAFRLDFQK